MGSGKQGISYETNSSSDENDDRQEVVKLENNADGATTASAATGKRSYECTFCKRGFTNAQALGGHMNIHRKDRAKPKHLTPGSSTSIAVSVKPNMNPNFPGQVDSGQRMHYYPVFETRSYFQQKISNGSNESGLMPNNQSNEQVWGENLSLRVGSDSMLGDKTGDVSKKDDELDLELRLGHDRY